MQKEESHVLGDGRGEEKEASGQAETVAAAGPTEPGERREASLPLQLQRCQEVSRGAAGPWVFPVLSWSCKTSLASSSP